MRNRRSRSPNEKKRVVAIDLSHQARRGGEGGGIGLYVRELLGAYRRLHPDDIEFVYLRGLKVLHKNNKLTKVLNLLAELLWLHAILPFRLARKRIDLVHMPANLAPLYSPCPVVVTIHDANFCRFPETYDPGYRRYARVAFSIAARRAARVVTVSSTSGKDAVRYFGARPEKVSVIHPGLSREPGGAPSRWRDAESPYILFVGAQEPHKNLVRLVEAFALFRAKETPARNYQLILVGAMLRDTGRITAAIARHDLDGAVRLTGILPLAKRDWLYKHASVFAFPSLNEGFGFPPLEAMARSVPVVAASAGALPEVLGDAALYCDPFDTEDIARALSRAAFDEPLRSRLVEAGLKQVQRFTWDEAAAATLDVYRGVLDA